MGMVGGGQHGQGAGVSLNVCARVHLCGNVCDACL